jgi:Holliday junction resolvase-like predicted endonuclease
MLVRPEVPSKASRSEQLVAAWLKRQHWTEIYPDLKCANVQVDLVARSPEGVLTVVEVKTQSAWQVARLSRQQALRLFRVAQVLAQEEPTQVCVAFVENGEIELVEVDALTDF